MTGLKDVVDFNDFYGVMQELSAWSGHTCKSVAKDMFDTYLEHKDHLFQLFGGKLRIEKEIDTTVSEYEAHEIKHDESQALLVKGLRFSVVANFLQRITAKELLANQLSIDYHILGEKLCKGTRLTKAISQLCLPQDVDTVQTSLSMVVQKIRTKGKIVLSIDPIDYLTVSTNNSNWSSCHRLNGGEYCNGPLAYLQDTSSCVAYMESRTPCVIAGVDVSNKAWRQMVMINPSGDYAIQEREYPNGNELNAQAVSEILQEILIDDEETPTVQNITSEQAEKLHIDYIESTGSCTMYYNDMVQRMVANVVLVAPKGLGVEEVCAEYEKPRKGYESICLNCGGSQSESETLHCYDCYDGYRDDDDDYWDE